MKDPEKYLQELKRKGLDAQREERFRAEIAGLKQREIPVDAGDTRGPFPISRGGSTPGMTLPCCRSREAPKSRTSLR